MRGRVSSIESRWRLHGFAPNPRQREAILHVDGPLYLTAGPGSGKTRVLLWRTLNLLVFHDIRPEQIFLSTFTEKAALQLREGLQALLGAATNETDRPFDLTQMYVGTVHALCQRIIADRRFAPDRHRMRPPTLLDALGQYFHLYRNRTWRAALAEVGLDAADGGSLRVNALFGGKYDSKHEAVQACLRLFNRLSEECVDTDEALARTARNDLPRPLQAIDGDGMCLLLRLYKAYRASLNERAIPATDFSLLQQEALAVLDAFQGSGDVFRHVIIDEYQDTNTIQERLIFRLAASSRNLCVVGDDDQALYRFRGATVENFVRFPERCRRYLDVKPRRIALSTNYRSLGPIVDVCGAFIGQCDWQRRDPGGGHYRVMDKDIQAHRPHGGPAVVTNEPARPEDACDEIADLVPLDFDAARVEETVADFGQVVDRIEGGTFGPRSVADLNKREGDMSARFATAVCRNCDARFSCGSYREWALSGVSRSNIERRFAEYYGEVLDRDPDAWRSANLATMPEMADLEEDFYE